MTFKDLEKLVRQETGDAEEPYFVSTASILAYANDAETEACLRSRLLTDSTTAEVCTVSLVAGTSVYAVDSRVLWVLRGEVSGENKPMGRVSFAVLDALVPDWRSHTGTPVAFVTGMGSGVMMVYPKPVAAGTLSMSVQRGPLVAMSGASSIPEIPGRLVPKLALWIKHRIYNIQDSELFDGTKAGFHLAEFETVFGKRPKEHFGLFESMEIPEYIPVASSDGLVGCGDYF